VSAPSRKPPARLTDNERLEAEGAAQKAKGDVQNKVGQAQDKIGDAIKH
jgi:uncharacterized protein YjbJ (UPF0337 family)